MRLLTYMQKELVYKAVQANDRMELFAKLTDQACSVHAQLDGGIILNLLVEREKTARTGLERGVAIPHAMIPGLEKPICVVATLANGLDFSTLDGSAVDIVFMLLSPENGIAKHIRLLARIARLSSNEHFLLRMREAEDAEDLFRVIKAEDERHV